MAEEKVVERALPSIGRLILWLLIGFVVLFISYLTRTLSTGKWWLVNGWFVTPLYIFIILEALRRISPRFRLNATECALLIITMFLFGGKTWIANHTGECNIFDVVSSWSFGAYTFVAMNTPATKPIYEELNLPTWFMPRDERALQIVWNGLKMFPGESINWSVWIGPIVSWSLVYISFFILDMLTTFLFVGPQWVDTEKLVFPMTVSSIFLVNTYTERDEKGRSLLFNFANVKTRIFWICALVGFLITLPIYIAMLFAPWWPITGWGLGIYWLDLRPFTEPILPGAFFYGAIYFGIIFWLILVPYDVLVSLILGWLIFSVIYPVTAFKLGWIPYTPYASYWSVGSQPIFPWTVMLFHGFPLGLGLWYIWTMRDRIKKALSAITKGSYMEHGIPMKLGVTLWIIMVIIFIGIWSAIGVNPLMVIIFIIMWAIFNISTARIYSEFGPWGCEWSLGVWTFTWPIGASIGLWAWEAPQRNTALAAFNILVPGPWGWTSGHTNCGPALPFWAQVYKFAHDSRANLWDVVKYLMTFIIIGIPAFLIFDTWLVNHMGLIHLEEYAANTWHTGWTKTLDAGIRTLGGPEGLPFNVAIPWALAGAIISIVLAFMRSKFPWFWLHPLMFAISPWAMNNMLWSVIIALALKFALFRTFGPKRTVEYIIPIIAGLLLGQSFFYLVAGVQAITQAAIPNIQANWG
ncbi:MAG: DUF6785 family protein [Candidatus Bathyarchaeia archaeon]